MSQSPLLVASIFFERAILHLLISTINLTAEQSKSESTQTYSPVALTHTPTERGFLSSKKPLPLSPNRGVIKDTKLFEHNSLMFRR
ncbi:MAG: hypothetical protein LBI79_02085 [Nitrososphaerota archaeon]|nr:hypothetical protein [Nitrososphaerota archaeon]